MADKVGFQYETKEFNLSGNRYLQAGGDPKTPSIPVIHDSEIEELRTFDAIYLGAVGHPEIAPGILEKGLLLRLRFELDQYINLRPVKLYPGVWTPLKDKGPEDIDFVVVRENTEGIYTGMGGVQYKGTPQEVSTQINCTTRFGAERAIRYAFEFCRRRNSRKRMLTLVHKTNVLTFAGDTWFRAFHEIGEKEYPDIKRDYNHVDACCMWFVKNPEYYDVIVTDNIFGDIITDLAAIIQGGLGVAAGGNINPKGVSMYEPMGGSAPKVHRQERHQSDRRHRRHGHAAARDRQSQERRPAGGSRQPRGSCDHGRHPQDEEPGRRTDGLLHHAGGRPRGPGRTPEVTRRGTCRC